MPTTKLKNGQLPDTIASKTIDNTNDISTTTTKLKISGGTNGQVLSTDGSSNLSWVTAGGVQIQTDTFTSTGTWTKPSWAKRVEVYLVGGGAGGSSGQRAATTVLRSGGAGGNGGAIAFGFFRASDLGATESVTIGAAGTGGASVTTNDTNANVGTSGGRTLFGSHFQAPGGIGSTVGSAQSTGIFRSLFPNTNEPTAGITGFNSTQAGSGSGSSGSASDYTKSGGGGGRALANVTTAGSGGAASSSHSNGTTLGYFQTQTTGAAGGTDGGNGANGSGSVTLFGVLTLGNGGGGGGYKTAQATGAGGNASNYGAGGGGGAGSDNGYASGAGGNGSAGMAVVISIG
jgi:hypothetical protein